MPIGSERHEDTKARRGIHDISSCLRDFVADPVTQVVERVTHLDDPGLALYRSVADPDLARSHGLFVAEGRFVVRRVLEDSRYRLRSVLVNDAARRDLAPLLDRRDPSVP